MICLISVAQNMQRTMHFLFSKLITQKELVALLSINEMWNKQAFKNYISYKQENSFSGGSAFNTQLRCMQPSGWIAQYLWENTSII